MSPVWETSRLPGTRRRTTLIAAGAAIALSLGAIALVGEAASYHDVVHAVTHADKRWLPLCALGELIAYGGYIVGYRELARAKGGPEFDLWTSTRVVAVGFGAFVVASGAGGFAVDYWALRRADEEPDQALRRVLALSALEWTVLGVLAAIGSAWLLGAGGGVPRAMTVTWLAAVPAALAAGAWLTSPQRAGRLTRLRNGGRGLAAKAHAGLAHVLAGAALVRELLAHPIRYPGGALGFVAYWCGDILCIDAALHAFGAPISPAATAVGYATGYVVTSLPLPFGAAGAAEATTSFALHAAGAPLSSAVLAVLVFRVFTFWLPIVAALAFLPTLRRLSDELSTPRSRR